MQRRQPDQPGNSNTSNIRTVSAIPRRVAGDFLVCHLKNANLRRAGAYAEQTPDLHFGSNTEFWSFFLSQSSRNMNWVKLEGFQLIDWYPRAPGLYHTRHAKFSREGARRFVRRDEGGEFFYEPSGKVHMIEGGIGCVRFKPIKIEGEECWMYSATSDSLCHSGIPLAIPDRLLARTNVSTFMRFAVRGQVRFLPEFLEERFHHVYNVPQIYILVDQLKFIEETRGSVYVTPVIFFTSSHSLVERGISRDFDENERNNVTYVTSNADSSGMIDEAAAWLDRYVHRYNGKIMTNFDQQRPTFRNAPFSLQNVMMGTVEIAELQHLGVYGAEVIIRSVQQLNAEVTNVTNNEVNIGDSNTFQGDFVVAGSITNSFNKVNNANASNEVKDLLKDLVTAVGEMSKKLPPEKQQEVAQDLDVLTTEAVKEKPRRKWWDVSSEGLVAAAKNIGDIGKPVLEILTKLAPLITQAAV